MFVIPIMVIIGVLNENNLWLYIALALTTLGATLKVGREQAEKKAAANKVASDIDNLLKSLRATQN